LILLQGLEREACTKGCNFNYISRVAGKDESCQKGNFDIIQNY